MDASTRIFWLLLGLMLLSFATLWTLQAVAIRVRWRRRPPPSRATPPISVLKPLKGADRELYANLEAFARQDHPDYELVFGVEDARDPAVEVVRRLIANHPAASISLCAGAAAIGMNPKVNNLAMMARSARHDLWLISDADVRPAPDYLRTLALEASSGVDLVHNVPIGRGERKLGSIFESLHLNAYVGATLRGAEALGHNCVVGKSMLFDRRKLEAVGGLGSVKDLLAEDYALGDRFRRAGFTVKLSSCSLSVVNAERSVATFFKRHLRWAQMRRWVCLRAYLSEALGNPVAWLLVWLPWAVFAAPAGRPEPWLTLGAVGLILKCLVDAIVMRVESGSWHQLRHLFWIPVKDLLIGCAWWIGWFDRRINWRGNFLWIGPETRLSSDPEGGRHEADPARA